MQSDGMLESSGMTQTPAEEPAVPTEPPLGSAALGNDAAAAQPDAPDADSENIVRHIHMGSVDVTEFVEKLLTNREDMPEDAAETPAVESAAPTVAPPAPPAVEKPEEKPEDETKPSVVSAPVPMDEHLRALLPDDVDPDGVDIIEYSAQDKEQKLIVCITDGDIAVFTRGEDGELVRYTPFSAYRNSPDTRKERFFLKNIKVSNNVIRRLPRYLRKLDELMGNGVSRISSFELGQQLGLTPSQIRQDFSCFGEFGQQGYGYNVSALHGQIASILGTDRGYRAILIGAGNIGHALMDNFCFSAWGFKLVAAFDIDPELTGTVFNDVPIYAMDTLEEYLQNNSVDVVVLTVPQEAAIPVTNLLTSNGVEAIWNFTNVDLTAPNSSIIVENVHFSDSLLSLSYYVSERNDEKAARAARAEKADKA